jgi:transcriptional regulator with XRE-family HTH domain
MLETTRHESLASRVGAKLRHVRTAKGLTLLDVANAMGTSPQTVQRLETANMTLSVEWVERFCRVLEIQPVDLFDGIPAIAFDVRLKRDNARAAIKVLCRALNVPCPESL